METFFQHLINGISLGSIYALIALGYTMVYGIIKLINFAHGEFYMSGAFIGLFALSTFHLPFPIALICAMVGAAGIAVFVEKTCYKPLRGADRISALITAIGVSLFLQNFGIVTLGAHPRPYPQVIPLKPYNIGGLVINNRQIIILGVSITLMILLHLFVHKTKLGIAMRAVSMDKDASRLVGIDVDQVISMTFAIGASLAGAAGVLVGIYYNSVDPLMGLIPGIKAFVAAVLGGIGIIPGAMLGGIIMGISESMVVGYLASTYRDAIAFTILILILLFKPSGILGRTEREKV